MKITIDPRKMLEQGIHKNKTHSLMKAVKTILFVGLIGAGICGIIGSGGGGSSSSSSGGSSSVSGSGK